MGSVSVPASVPPGWPSSGRSLPASSAKGSFLAFSRRSPSAASGGGGPASGARFSGSSRDARTSFFGAVFARGTMRSGIFFGSMGFPSLRSVAATTGRSTSGFSSACGGAGWIARNTNGAMKRKWNARVKTTPRTISSVS